MGFHEIYRDLFTIDVIDGFVRFLVVGGLFVVIYFSRLSTQYKLMIAIALLVFFLLAWWMKRFFDENNKPVYMEHPQRKATTAAKHR